jgi:hypothetical protein
MLSENANIKEDRLPPTPFSHLRGQRRRLPLPPLVALLVQTGSPGTSQCAGHSPG